MELLARNGIFTGFVTSFRINNLEMVDHYLRCWNQLTSWLEGVAVARLADLPEVLAILQRLPEWNRPLL